MGCRGQEVHRHVIPASCTDGSVGWQSKSKADGGLVLEGNV